MLKTLQPAFDDCGKPKARIARECGKTPQTIYGWCSGRFYIYPRCRDLLEKSLRAEIDWPAYEIEYRAIAATIQPDPPPPALPDDPPPPALPDDPPKRTAPAAPRKPAPQARRAIPAPPTPKNATLPPAGGFGAFLAMLKPDPTDNGAKFE